MSKQKSRGKKNATMADNQVAFRKMNSKLKKLIDDLNAIAVGRGEPVHTFQKDDVYQFYCECSDENCLARIPLSFETYEKAHERDDTFTIIPGHEVFDIEEIIFKVSNYCIVRKFETPKQSNAVLHQTAVNNVA